MNHTGEGGLLQLCVVTPTPSLRHDGGNQAPNANKCEGEASRGTNLLANPPSPDVVKWVTHTVTDPYLFTAWGLAAGSRWVGCVYGGLVFATCRTVGVCVPG